jgi:hypothetical protein
MRVGIRYLIWLLAAVALGFVLAQYTTGGMLFAFLHKLPGCF